MVSAKVQPVDDTLDDDLRTFARDGILLKDMGGSVTPSSTEAVKTLMRILEYATGDREVRAGGFKWAKIGFKHHAVDLQRVMHSDTFASCIKVSAPSKAAAHTHGPPSLMLTPPSLPCINYH